jgi:hypothetical protein
MVSALSGLGPAASEPASPLGGKLGQIVSAEVLRFHRARIFLTGSIITGALMGVLLLHPINEFVYYFEHEPDASSWRTFVLGQLLDSLTLKTPQKTLFYAIVGAVLGLLSSVFYRALQKRTQKIQQLYAALEQDIRALIDQGESESLEFKSSLRWDRKAEKLNKALEGSVIKTLAGYMNGEGGTLLIGVADDGQVAGLKEDYESLKKPNRDGFEQVILNAVAARMGTDACGFLQVVFHRIEENDVCRVIAAPARRPVYVKNAGQPKFYLRTGVSTRELNVQEAVDYIAQRW